jgi:hypothetical protein
VELMRGALALGKAAPIVRHLLSGCARCTAITRTLWSFGGEAPNRGRLLNPFQPARPVEVWR